MILEICETAFLKKEEKNDFYQKDTSHLKNNKSTWYRNDKTKTLKIEIVKSKNSRKVKRQQ